MAGRARAEHDFDPIRTRTQKRKRTSSPEATTVKNGSVQLIDHLGLQTITGTTTNTTTRAIIWHERKEFCAYTSSAPSFFLHCGEIDQLERCWALPVDQFLEPIVLDGLSFPRETSKSGRPEWKFCLVLTVAHWWHHLLVALVNVGNVY
jgi:hypothetical protein